MSSIMEEIVDKNKNAYDGIHGNGIKSDDLVSEQENELADNGMLSIPTDLVEYEVNTSDKELSCSIDEFCNDDGNGEIVNEISNDISLELFTVIFDKIHINRGTLENIWYIEIEKDDKIFWSSVIMCDFDNNNGLNKGFSNLVRNCSNGRIIKTNGEELDSITITDKELLDLLMQDGIVGKDKVYLFTSIGFWKSVFLTLNYSAYLMRKREILYSKEVNEYILKFNGRKEVIGRRMKNTVNEEERIKLIKSIYGRMQILFTSVTNNESNHVVDNDYNHKSNSVRISYKTPLFWASSVGLIYILEKIGMLDYMLLVIEYVSELIPEVIFEFNDISDNPIVKSLNDLNNDLLKSISMNYQEYLSDLLSISKRSIKIMNSYLKNNSQEKGNIQNSCEGEYLNVSGKELDLKKNNKLSNEVETNTKDNNNTALSERKKPNYMKPTKQSEIRRQSIMNITEKEEKRENKGLTINLIKEKERIVPYDRNKLSDMNNDKEQENTSDQMDNNLSEGDEENSNVINDRTNDIRIQNINYGIERHSKDDISKKKRSYGRSVTKKSDNKRVSIEEKVRKSTINKEKVETSNYLGVGEVKDKNILTEKMDSTGRLFENDTVLSKKQIEQNISNFDDELNNIISEIDKIKIDGVQIIKEIVSTNASEESNSYQISGFYENSNVGVNEVKNKLYIDMRGGEIEMNHNYNLAKVEEVTSPMDPYDWYYTSNSNRKENKDGEMNVIEEFVKTDEKRKIEPEADTENKGIHECEGNKNYFDLKYIESILDKEIEELQKRESELANDLI
ncbi:hypothetical protein FG379_001057 [Cryptosporidium bovis]|uniref:uncharacterized protein n=1 Tax=Cryptosporidium bovis TaxID=310047 RepID=UPI003519F682|nr:hypothetical protein FG379_001057 [Cryptosporidium bovis]